MNDQIFSEYFNIRGMEKKYSLSEPLNVKIIVHKTLYTRLKHIQKKHGESGKYNAKIR